MRFIALLAGCILAHLDHSHSHTHYTDKGTKLLSQAAVRVRKPDLKFKRNVEYTIVY